MTTTRREFLQTCSVAAIGTVVPFTAIPVKGYDLFELTDMYSCALHWEESTWMAIWAPNELAARRKFMELYEYAIDCDEDMDTVTCVRSHSGHGKIVTRTEREEDWSILQKLGWREEGDVQCEVDELWYGASQICDDCYSCGDCCVCRSNV